MKAVGPIPEGFRAADNGQLEIADHSAGYWIERAGRTPLFLYDAARIAAKIDAFRAAMPDRVALHYAVKANPYAPLLDFMAARVDGFDLASRGELARARHLDLPLSMAGPGKSDADLEAGIVEGITIHVESRNEIGRACRIGQRLGRRPRLAVRINPPFMLKGAGMKMGGLASPFGMDRDKVVPAVDHILECDCDWRGFHIYAGSQSLSADAILDAQAATLALVRELSEEVGQVPPEVNLGGGFGIPYYSGEKPLGIGIVGDALGTALDTMPDDFAETRFILELGRWLVGEAGVYLTRIIDAKDSGEQRFLVTDGGMQHMLAATGNFGQFLRRNYPIANATRFDEPVEGAANVVGRLCTPLDLLGDQVPLPECRVGDVIAIFCAGAYGLTASPRDFLSQPQAMEMLVHASG